MKLNLAATITQSNLYNGVALKRDHLLVEVLCDEHNKVVVDAVKQTQQYVTFVM